MNRRESSKMETRRLILEAARALFGEKGMEEVTLRDIAARAGASPASVIVHFKTKIALLEESLADDIEQSLSAVVGSMPAGAGLLDTVMHLWTGMLTAYDRNRDLYRTLISLTIFQPAAETPTMTRQSEQCIRMLSSLIEGQKADGSVRPGTDPTIAAASLFSIYVGALIAFFRIPEMGVEGAASLLRAMTGQYLDGILEVRS